MCGLWLAIDLTSVDFVLEIKPLPKSPTLFAEKIITFIVETVMSKYSPGSSPNHNANSYQCIPSMKETEKSSYGACQLFLKLLLQINYKST